MDKLRIIQQVICHNVISLSSRHAESMDSFDQHWCVLGNVTSKFILTFPSKPSISCAHLINLLRLEVSSCFDQNSMQHLCIIPILFFFPRINKVWGDLIFMYIFVRTNKPKYMYFLKEMLHFKSNSIIIHDLLHCRKKRANQPSTVLSWWWANHVTLFFFGKSEDTTLVKAYKYAEFFIFSLSFEVASGN